MNGIGDIGIRFSSVEAHLVPLSFAIFTFESFWSRSVYFVGRPNMIKTQCDYFVFLLCIASPHTSLDVIAQFCNAMMVVWWAPSLSLW